MVKYLNDGDRVWPRSATVASIKLRTDNIPRHPDHRDTAAYFPFGEKAVVDILEGQLAFLMHVRAYQDNHPGTHILQRQLEWKVDFLRCCLGCLSKQELLEVDREIAHVEAQRHLHGSYYVRTSKALSRHLRHSQDFPLGKFLEGSVEQLQRTSVKPFDWNPDKFFAFIMANSKGRFALWVAPSALTFGRFMDWDFQIGVGAIQGHSRLPDQVEEVSYGEKLTLERCQQLGYIFHSTYNQNYAYIRQDGLSLGATKEAWQRHRRAIHFVYAGGEIAPGMGTVIRYGSNVFYAQLDYTTFLEHGNDLYLTANGVVLSYKDIAPMYLSFHYRPPHEKDPGGVRFEKKQMDTSSAAPESSPPGEASGKIKAKPMPKKRPRASGTTGDDSGVGSSAPAEVPTLDAEALRQLIKENDLKEAKEKEKEKEAQQTTSEGSTRYAYEAGDTVHGRVDATKISRERDLQDLISQARTNPWHLMKHGFLHRIDGKGHRVYGLYGEAIVKVTPWEFLPKSIRSLLGEEYDWSTWLTHPLSGYSVHFFLKAFELGKLQGNLLLEINEKPKTYPGGYRSPYEDNERKFPGGLGRMMNKIHSAIENEFRPDFQHVGFDPPSDDDPRAIHPKTDDPDYSDKLKKHNAFLRERDVYVEISRVRDDFSMLVSVVTEAYGPNFFSYIKKHASNLDIRRRYKVTTSEGFTLFDCTLREDFNAPYLLSCLEKYLQNTEGKDFKSSFARKARSELQAYEELKRRRQEDLEELYSRPLDDLVVEEFLENLPSPIVEEIPETQPMDTSEDVKAESADPPLGGIPDPAPAAASEQTPMETDVPEHSSFEETSGTRVEPTDDVPMGEKVEEKDDAMSGESSPPGEESPPEMSHDATDEEPPLFDQGIWGKCSVTLDKDLWKKYLEGAQKQNEAAFEKLDGAKDRVTLEETVDYKEWCTRHFPEESPLTRLSKQTRGYGLNGIYHTNIRSNKLTGFKVQHMRFRATGYFASVKHPYNKYEVDEVALVEAMNTLYPIYERREASKDVVFRTGDVRSTYDQRLMERASDVKASVMEIEAMLLQKVKDLKNAGTPATRNELASAMLHHFLSGSVDQDDLGDLTLVEISDPRQNRFGLGEDGPVPVYTSRSKYSVLVLNMGNLARGRKMSVPSVYRDLLNWDDTSGSDRNLFIRAIGQAKAHVFLLCEAGDVNKEELDYLHGRGWHIHSNPYGDLLVGFRSNGVRQNARGLAGSTYFGVAHEFMPLSYMIVDMCYGMTLPPGVTGDRRDFADDAFTHQLTRAGSDRLRVCVFHLNNKVASSQVALAHECLASMFLDCLHFGVDLIGGDPNMALYRASGSRQQSMDIKGGMYQSLLDYMLEAWLASPKCLKMCCPRVQHVSANSILTLKQYEDMLGNAPYHQCAQLDWNTFPGLDPIVCSVFEWGHSMSTDEWSLFLETEAEFTVKVSEWLLNSTRSSYLLTDRDNDSHTPLLLEVRATVLSNQQRKALDRNPNTLQEAGARRKERQRANRQKGREQQQPTSTTTPSSTGAASSSQRPPEPAHAPKGAAKGSARPTEPSQPPKGKSKGSGKSDSFPQGKGSTAKGGDKGKSKGDYKGKSGKDKGKGKY